MFNVFHNIHENKQAQVMMKLITEIIFKMLILSEIYISR